MGDCWEVMKKKFKSCISTREREEPHDQMSDAPGGTIALLTTCISLPVLEEGFE